MMFLFQPCRLHESVYYKGIGGCIGCSLDPSEVSSSGSTLISKGSGFSRPVRDHILSFIIELPHGITLLSGKSRRLDKSAYQKKQILFPNQNMLWVLKRAVSIRRFF